MKSIEELLEIIKGVDMDLWDNVEQEAYDEILSRFAELESLVEKLKVCGNCKYNYDNHVLICVDCYSNEKWEAK